MLENCTYQEGDYCRENNSCLLIEELSGQAKVGGYKNKNLTKSAGEYWPEQTWLKYSERIVRAASQGCVCAQQIVELAKKLTEEKYKSGQLVLKNPTK